MYGCFRVRSGGQGVVARRKEYGIGICSSPGRLWERGVNVKVGR